VGQGLATPCGDHVLQGFVHAQAILPADFVYLLARLINITVS
jgi:hypothetical protein